MLKYLPVVFLTACSSVSGGPKDSLNSERDFSKIIINETLDIKELAELVDKGAIVDKPRRNTIIQARMAEIDVLYFEYENQISRDLRQGNFGLSLVGLAAGTAGSLAGETASKNWSAFSALLEGGKASYDRDVLLDQSLQVFVTQMRANRAAVKTEIVSRFSASSQDYTLQFALSDLAAYQQAGTLSAALAGITKSAQEDAAKNENTLQQTEDVVIRNQTKANVSASMLDLLSWIDAAPDDATKTTRRTQIIQCYQLIDRSALPTNVRANTGLFLARSGDFPIQTAAIVECLVAKGFGPSS